jgi:chromosome partitioning protein
MSKKIAFVNGKGGTGKTTLSMLVAGILKDRGQDVCIDDRDPQGNATAVAEAFGIPVKTDADFVIIDTSPDIERPASVQAIREADLLVIVTRPEFFDLVSTLATAKVVQRERNPQAKTVVVFNQVRANTIVGREMLDAKSKIPFPTLNAIIHQRASYSKANRFGWKALEPRERAEVLELCIELLSL